MKGLVVRTIGLVRAAADVLIIAIQRDAVRAN